MLGRGALLLTAGAFDLALWLFGAVLALFGLLSSIKAMTERLTQVWLRRKRRGGCSRPQRPTGLLWRSAAAPG